MRIDSLFLTWEAWTLGEYICKEKVVDPRVLEIAIAFDSVEVSEGLTESGKLKEGSK
jgi:hypothetical protein